MTFQDATKPMTDDRGPFSQEACDKWVKEIGFGRQYNPGNRPYEDPRYVKDVPIIEHRYKEEVIKKTILAETQKRKDNATNALIV